jgi:hypothetical protein
LLNCALLLAVPPDMFWCLLTCCVLAIIGRHEVCDFSLVLWADFVWSFLGHYRPWWQVFDFFWNYFFWNYFSLKLFFWNYPKATFWN